MKINFKDILNRKAIAENGDDLGKIFNVIVEPSQDAYFTTTRIMKSYYLPANRIKNISDEGVIFSIASTKEAESLSAALVKKLDWKNRSKEMQVFLNLIWSSIGVAATPVPGKFWRSTGTVDTGIGDYDNFPKILGEIDDWIIDTNSGKRLGFVLKEFKILGEKKKFFLPITLIKMADAKNIMKGKGVMYGSKKDLVPLG